MTTRSRRSLAATLYLSVLLASAGKAYAQTDAIHVFRLDPDGSLDTDFADEGHFIDNVTSTSHDMATSIYSASGKYVIGGASGASSQIFMVGRLNTDGTPDTTFHHDGYATTNFTQFDSEAVAAIADSAGKVVAVGTGVKPGHTGIAVARWTSVGELDPSFSGDGKEVVDVPGWTLSANGVAVLPGGKIMTVGSAVSETTGEGLFFVVRLNSDGSFDKTFDGDGAKAIAFPGATYAFGQDIAVHLGETQIPGWTVVVGGAVAGNVVKFAVALMKPDGQLEKTFSGDGMKLITFPDAASQQASSVKIDYLNAAMVLGGSATVGGEARFALARVRLDGSLDPTFGVSGTTTTTFSNLSSESIYDIAIGGSARIVAVGTGFTADGEYQAAVARYNGDGSPMKSFSGDGKTVIDAEFDDFNIPSAVMLGAGDKVVAAGHVHNR